MSGYIEVMVQGNCRAYLAVGNIAGVITSPGAGADVVATADQPMALLLTSGETLPGVYGVSPNRFLVHIEGIKMLMRERGRLTVVGYIDSHEALEQEIQAYISGRGD